MINDLKKQILRIVESAPRLSAKTVADMLGKEEKEVQAALCEMEADGTILGCKTIIDWDKTDREYVTAIIELKVTPQRDMGFERLAERISNFPEVKDLFLMSGGYDFSVIVEGKTMRQVAFFVAEKLSPIDGVVSTSTHFVLRKYKDSGVIYGEKETPDERGNML